MKDEIKHRMTRRLTGWALVERWIRLYRDEGRKWLAHDDEAKPRELRLVRVSVGE